MGRGGRRCVGTYKHRGVMLRYVVWCGTLGSTADANRARRARARKRKGHGKADPRMLKRAQTAGTRRTQCMHVLRFARGRCSSCLCATDPQLCNLPTYSAHHAPLLAACRYGPRSWRTCVWARRVAAVRRRAGTRAAGSARSKPARCGLPPRSQRSSTPMAPARAARVRAARPTALALRRCPRLWQ